MLEEATPSKFMVTKTRKELTPVNSDQELSDESQKGNQTSYTNRKIPQKNNRLSEICPMIQLKRIYIKR